MADNEENKIKESISFLIELAKKNNITPYQLGKKSSISSSSVNKIFSGENKSPKLNTLLKLKKDLENLIESKKYKVELKPEHRMKPITHLVEDLGEDYILEFDKLKIDDKLNIIYKEIVNIKKTLQDY